MESSSALVHLEWHRHWCPRS